MPLLFSYGTLQQEDVQLSTFGRRLQGRPDALPRFGQDSVMQYTNVTFNGDERSRVPGMVFEVTDAELARADEYEEPALYTRIMVTLASGIEAWVYRCHSTRVTRHIDAPRPAVLRALVDAGFVEVVPDEKLVDPVEKITITLTDVVGGTDVVAVHEALPIEVKPSDNEARWRSSLDNLAALVEE